MRLPWLIASLGFAALLAILEQVSLRYYLFWRLPWFDTVLHATGGITIGLLVIGLLEESFKPLAYLGLVVLAAIGWEVFEYAIGTPHGANFRLDTASDLLFDAIGALIPYAIARSTIWRSN